MDFSYLDKPEYKDIQLFDENEFILSSNNRHFFIQKYSADDNISLLHRHNYIQINYVYKGSGYHLINNKKIEIMKGDIFIIPPYVPHVITSDHNKNLGIVEFEFTQNFILPSQNNQNDTSESYIDFAYLEPFMVVEEELKPRFNLSDKMQADVEAIFDEALEEYTNMRPGYILIARALILKLLVITGRAFSSDIKGTETEEILNKYKSSVLKASEYIKENYEKDLTLDKIASHINYSRSYFCYLFKAVTGKNYVEYLNEVRISHAKELLTTTDKNIGDISFDVGFKTIANFNKYFKQLTGVTPSKYRNLKKT